MAVLLRTSKLLALTLAIAGSTSLASTMLAAPARAAQAAAPEKPAPTKPTATPPAKPTPAVEPPPGPATPPPEEPVEEPVPADPTPAEPEPDPAPTIDASAVAELQAEARALRDALFKARGRVSMVAAKLFTTRVSLRLRSNLERFYAVSNLTLTMDGAPVYVQGTGLPSTDGDLFEVFAAPGSHELGIAVELVSRRDATYKIRIDHAIGFAVEPDARVSTRLVLRETGNMWRLSRGQRGRSSMRVRLDAKSKPTKSGAKGKAKASATVTAKGAK